MKELKEYLREVVNNVDIEVAATLEPFISERAQNEPLIINLNDKGVDDGES